MKSKLFAVLAGLGLHLAVAQTPGSAGGGVLGYHTVQTDAENHILPWNDPNPALAYDQVLGLTWTYWKNIPGYWMRHEPGFKQRFSLQFPPLYLMFRTQDPADLGIGGGQFAQMLSSFNLYYDYTGDPAVLENMKFQADWYIKWGFSDAHSAWPNLPYPCNTEQLPVYDGDLVLGKGYTQPDKAGDFGYELMILYKKTGVRCYLEKAAGIANTLAAHTGTGDYDHSPLPFKVNALTGETGFILGKDGKTKIASAYTTNWTGTLRLFQQLIDLGYGDTAQYGAAFGKISAWLRAYPLTNNRWGPYFEDITSWSDTEINAGLLAWFIMDNRDWVADWSTKVRGIQNWVVDNLGIDDWKQYGLGVIGEQTIYKVQGQSHTARHASIELRYAELTGDQSRVPEAIRQLNWCTYAVDHDGKNRWPNPTTYEIWWSDGYGDYMRHFLRAMAAFPVLVPARSHLLESSSVVQSVRYKPQKINYATFDAKSRELLRMAQRPRRVSIDGIQLVEGASTMRDRYEWKPLIEGGVLEVIHVSGKNVEIDF